MISALMLGKDAIALTHRVAPHDRVYVRPASDQPHTWEIFLLRSSLAAQHAQGPEEHTLRVVLDHQGAQLLESPGLAGADKAHNSIILPGKNQHQIVFRPQASADHSLTLSLDSERMKALHPTAVETASGWALAWLREDTGRVSLEVATISHAQWLDHGARGKIERRRVAEVWTALDPASLALAAPSIASVGDRFAIVWREHRGPVPSVYLKTLNAVGMIEGPELRVSSRGVPAERIAPVIASRPNGDWACVFSEIRDGVSTVCLAYSLHNQHQS
jgi:hypothetical protein